MRGVHSRFWTAAVAIACSQSALGQDVARLSPLRTIQFTADDPVGEPPVVTGIALSPNGRLAAIAGDDHLVRLWNMDDGRQVQTLRGHADWVRSVAFSPDGKRLASGGYDRRILLWDVAGARLIRTIDDGQAALHCLAFSPDGRNLAAVGFDKELRIYDGPTGNASAMFDCPGTDTRSVAFSPDGRLLAAAGRSGGVRVWDTATASVAFERRLDRVRCLAFSPDGTMLACAGDDRRIAVVSSATGGEIVSLPAKFGRALSLTFCGDQRLAAGCSDNVVHVWNLASSQEEFRLLGHTGSVSALALDSGNGRLISGSFDTTMRIWQLPWNRAATGEKNR